MNIFKSFTDALYSVNDGNFEDIALRLFTYQAIHNPIYNQYLKNLKVDVGQVKSLNQIPFLPIQFFKSHAVKTGEWNAVAEFTSSGTTGSVSRHSVYDMNFYVKTSLEIFTRTYGPVSDYHILALLPSYLERSGSSLIAMIDHFIKASQSPYSGFYLYNHSDLKDTIQNLQGGDRKILLWGVSFALLDFADSYRINLQNAVVMETGGMKGRRKELIREELHDYLKDRLGATQIHSEYGMTELMSQAYSQGGGYYKSPPWMKVLIRELNDPFQTVSERAGIVNVVDLANFHSCAFIETQDLGRMNPLGEFEVLGRMDNSDIRGCNLLVG